jgi:hypothetical protein
MILTQRATRLTVTHGVALSTQEVQLLAFANDVIEESALLLYQSRWPRIAQVPALGDDDIDGRDKARRF